MNCKPGDLALVLRPPSWAGKVVTVLRRSGPPDWAGMNFPGSENLWEVDRALGWAIRNSTQVVLLPLCPDDCLMPIRPEADPESVLTEQEIAR